MRLNAAGNVGGPAMRCHARLAIDDLDCLLWRIVLPEILESSRVFDGN